ncbi:hypothetical protein KCP77_04070 [Salmonella enterica subsp. enterica]|nr:hypothetical protein KCP77_04070 [Salmonella enterica subsp. enterica]
MWRICKLHRPFPRQSDQSQTTKPYQDAGRMELIAPAHVDSPFHFSFRAESLPNPLLKMEKVSTGYGDRIILEFRKLNTVLPTARVSACWAATARGNRR